MEILEDCAYHESGRIVMAYTYGYTCDGTELSDTDAGRGQTRINGGDDLPYIQVVLQRAIEKNQFVGTNRANEVAEKLLNIYCVGSCTEIFYNNDKKIDPEMEMRFPGQDHSQLELINSFLKKNDPAFSEDKMNTVLNSIFMKLQKIEFTRPIEALVKEMLNSEGYKLSRFQIEDALKSVGFSFVAKKQSAGFAVSLSEDQVPSRTTVAEADISTPGTQALKNEELLDSVLQKFILNLRGDLTAEEVHASITFLKDVFQQMR